MTNLNKYHYFSDEHKVMVLNTFKKFLIVNGTQVTKTYYTAFQRRIGASKVLNRKQKLSVYMALENAMNHVSFGFNNYNHQR